METYVKKKESSDMMFIFDPQCHTLVTFFLNLPTAFFNGNRTISIDDFVNTLKSKGDHNFSIKRIS